MPLNADAGEAAAARVEQERERKGGIKTARERDREKEKETESERKRVRPVGVVYVAGFSTIWSMFTSTPSRGIKMQDGGRKMWGKAGQGPSPPSGESQREWQGKHLQAPLREGGLAISLTPPTIVPI